MKSVRAEAGFTASLYPPTEHVKLIFEFRKCTYYYLNYFFVLVVYQSVTMAW